MDLATQLHHIPPGLTEKQFLQAIDQSLPVDWVQFDLRAAWTDPTAAPWIAAFAPLTLLSTLIDHHGTPAFAPAHLLVSVATQRLKALEHARNIYRLFDATSGDVDNLRHAPPVLMTP